MKKSAVISTALVGVLIALVIVILGDRSEGTQQLSSGELALLNPDWSLATGGNWSPWVTARDGSQEWNPTASFNAWVDTIPHEARAWPHLADALIEYEELWSHEWNGAQPKDNEDWGGTVRLYSSSWSRGGVDQVVRAFHQPFLGKIDRQGTDSVMHALLVERGLEDEDWNEHPLENPDPWVNATGLVSDLRSAVFELSTPVYVALESESDTERFLQILIAMFDGSDLILTRMRLLDHLQYVPLYGNCLSVIEWGLRNHSDKFDELELEVLERVLALYPPRVFEATGEILWVHDHYRRLVDSNGEFDIDQASDVTGVDAFYSPSHEPIEKLDSRIQQVLHFHTNQFNKLAEKSTMPWDGTELEYADFLAGIDRVPEGMHEVILMNKFLVTYWERNLELQVRRTALRIAIASERHRFRNGQYPAGFESFDEDLISFDINDPFTNEPLIFRVGDRGAVVYSAGTDRDDDGGVPMLSMYKNPNYAAFGSSFLNRTDGSISVRPHWISRERAEAIGDQSLIDGDWVLYPMPE